MTVPEPYAIWTDATCDLPVESIAENGIGVIPMEFHFGAEGFVHYPDYRNISYEEFFRRIRAGETATTSQITTTRAIEAFTPDLEAGRDLLFISLSVGVSGSFHSVCLACDALRARFPERKIFAVDSKSCSLGEGMMVLAAAKSRASGMEIRENAAWCEAEAAHFAHWLTVADLNHLRRGGRCTALASFMGNLLNLRPVLHVDAEGKLVPVEKVRSHKKALERLCEIALERGKDIKQQQVIVGHCDDIEGAQYLERLLHAAGVEDTAIHRVGPVVSSHVGPGTIAVFFLSEQR